MKLQFKFKDGAAAAERREVVRALKEEGLTDVRPLFPGAKDSQLDSLYLVELNGRDGDEVLTLLNSSSAVDFAEPEVRRKLVGG